jgi:hypothetical protein
MVRQKWIKLPALFKDDNDELLDNLGLTTQFKDEFDPDSIKDVWFDFNKVVAFYENNKGRINMYTDADLWTIMLTMEEFLIRITLKEDENSIFKEGLDRFR